MRPVKICCEYFQFRGLHYSAQLYSSILVILQFSAIYVCTGWLWWFATYTQLGPVLLPYWPQGGPKTPFFYCQLQMPHLSKCPFWSGKPTGISRNFWIFFQLNQSNARKIYEFMSQWKHFSDLDIWGIEAGIFPGDPSGLAWDFAGNQKERLFGPAWVFPTWIGMVIRLKPEAPATAGFCAPPTVVEAPLPPSELRRS